MAWREVEGAAPEFAQRVWALFDAHWHETIATLLADGLPRIRDRGGLRGRRLGFGSMLNARTGADLRRDPRFALHSATVDPVESCEAKRLGEANRFHADIAEVVHTYVNKEATMLVIDWQTPGHGLQSIDRD
jgi:hypothetical protein